jgi:copper chaperone NosL
MKIKYIILPVLLFLASCSIEPKEINYGKDACSYCKMNIVDQQHAAEIVTQKGKVYMYDAIECMLRDEDHNNVEEVGLYLVMDYNNPNTFLKAEEAFYLISEEVPSPMGGNLSSFSTKDAADQLQEEKSGTVYDWSGIREEF